MTIIELLTTLRQLQVHLWADGSQLQFSAAKGVMTTELRAALVQHKAELLALLHESRVGGQKFNTSLVPIMRPEPLPLSFAQERLWFLDQLQPENTAYNVPSVVRLVGSLDIASLQHSIATLIQRHETLRSTFPMVAGQPIQVIVPEMHIPIPLIDLRSVTIFSPNIVSILIEAEIQRPFQLEQGPLIRAILMWVNHNDYLVLLTMHHIITDGWSRRILLQELATLYEAYTTHQPAQLPALPIQYADYAVWQRFQLRQEVLASDLNYWRHQLAHLSILALPTDYPRPTTLSFRGTNCHYRLSDALCLQLRVLSHQHNVTLFMVLLAAFQSLLLRYTGQHDITVGSVVSNRNHPDIENLIGFFVNTLVFRVDLSGTPSFAEVLTRVRSVALDAYAHQEVPFATLVSALQPERDTSRQSLFQVAFAVHNFPNQSVVLPNVTMTPVSVNSKTAKFDLSIEIHELDQGLDVFIEYCTDLFMQATIDRLFNHFQNLLMHVVDNHLVRVTEIPLLSSTEQHLLIHTWNDTATLYQKEIIFPELLRYQVDQQPDAPALICEGQYYSYFCTYQRASQIAQALQAIGMSSNITVAVCLERTPELIFTLLGILLAGGSYVPLDPQYPPDRLKSILTDSRAEVLITQKLFLVYFTNLAVHTFCIDQDGAHIAENPQQHLSNSIASGQLAYLMYTSGSTGRPKGVMVSHQNVMNFCIGMNAIVPCTRQDRVLAITSVAFDISVLELLWTLSRGATVVLIVDPREQLLTQAVTQQVTIAQATPSLLQAVLSLPTASVDLAQIPLQTLLIGGETLPPTLVQQLQRATSAQVMNMYGPTETTIWSATHPVQRVEPVIPIGRPTANTELYVLDTTLQPVPIGVTGDLYIGGEGVTRGYVGQPALSATRFGPHPFSQYPGQRLYQTGDRARYRADGTLECLGRTDSQIKIRGHRVELGEIEHVTQQLPNVHDTIVVVSKSTDHEEQLVAYVIVDDRATCDIASIRVYLSSKLPSYMVPSVFIPLETWPLTPNGKVNREALPQPEIQWSAEVPVIPPTTSIERLVSEIWSDVIGRQPISIHDNFFELGGHSLHTVQVMARVQDIFQIHIPLRLLFEQPTVATFVAVLAEMYGGYAIIEEIADTFFELAVLSDEEVQIALERETTHS